jgi:rhomboid-related protein 1/2/3
MIYLIYEQIVRKYWTNRQTFNSKPIFITTISLIELLYFIYCNTTSDEQTTTGVSIPIDSIFIYRPDKRCEIWRFITYMVIHSGYTHLIFNLIVQLLVGLPLELNYGSRRIGAIYLSGILFASLGASVFEPEVYLVGSSGGVYAVLSAYLIHIILNFKQIDYALLRLFTLLLIPSAEVVIVIYKRLIGANVYAVSYVSHMCGALAGITVSILVFKYSYPKSRYYHTMWWFSLLLYLTYISLAILYNIY